MWTTVDVVCTLPCPSQRFEHAQSVAQPKLACCCGGIREPASCQRCFGRLWFQPLTQKMNKYVWFRLKHDPILWVHWHTVFQGKSHSVTQYSEHQTLGGHAAMVQSWCGGIRDPASPTKGLPGNAPGSAPGSAPGRAPGKAPGSKPRHCWDHFHLQL